MVRVVGLPIGLGVLSGFITGQSSRDKWYLVSNTLARVDTSLRQAEPHSPSRKPAQGGLRPGQYMLRAMQADTDSSQVWTILYGLMGYASHMTVRAFDSAVTPQATSISLMRSSLFTDQVQ